MLRALACLSLSLAPLGAQDMMAVAWTGQTYTLDSYTGTLTPLGTAPFGQNACDRVGGIVWSTRRVTFNPSVYDVTILDPTNGTGFSVFNNTPDIRAMASDGAAMWVILEGPFDELAILDLTTGQTTPIGSTGLGGIQGATFLDGVLYASDIGAGLVTIDTATGVATDVNTAIGAPPAGSIQFLASRADGTLIGGGTSLYEIDPGTGSYTLISNHGIDLRGATEVYGYAQNFGVGCNGEFGPTSLTIGGTLVANGTITLDSGNHAANAPGTIMLGITKLDTPFDLDALFGTVGCSLYPSPQLAIPGTTSATGPANLSFSFNLTPTNGGLVLFLQHLVLENVPGMLSATDAAVVHIGY